MVKTSIRMEYYFTSGRITIVRSKSEVVIADHLLSNKINYDYEPEVTVGDKKFRPDFVAYDPDDDDIFWYWDAWLACQQTQVIWLVGKIRKLIMRNME